MKKQILFLLVIGLIGHAIYTLNPKETYEKPLPFATHALLIFLDDSEEEMGSIACSLIVALSQKAGPILASTSLLAAIDDNPTASDLIKAEPDNELYKSLETRYQGVKKRIPELIGSKSALSLNDQEGIVAQLNKEFPPMPPQPENIALKISMAAMREAFSFNPNDWIIKAADSEKRLVLLIPKDYTNSGNGINLRSYQPVAKKLNINDPLTSTEYQTGLKIDHMQTIKNYAAVFPQEFTYKEHADYFMQAVWPRKVGANCSDIFVSNAEYAQAKMQSPAWLMYAGGHGEQEESSIGLTLDMFKQFLDFMNSKIQTSLFAYITCFAVGTNTQLVYQDERQLAKAYSFIIITQGVTDSVTMTYSGFTIDNFELGNIDFANKALDIAPYENYVQFIKNFTTVPEIANFGSAISPIMSLERKEGILEVPHIRLKGRDFFTLADVTNKIAIMGNVFAKTCSTVDLTKYFTKKGITPEYYLVYAPTIACELIISALPDRIPYFIPMFTPERSEDSATFEYHIKKITAPNLSLVDIITTFSSNVPDSNNAHVQIDDLNARAGTLLKTKENELVSFKDVNIASKAEPTGDREEYDQLSEKYAQLNKERNQLLEEYDQLTKQYQEKKESLEKEGMYTQLTKLYSQTDLMLAELTKMYDQMNKLESEGLPEPEIHIACYFMYNNMPYKFDKDGQPAQPLQEDYRNKFNKPSTQPERFEKIKELQKKHIHLQKLKKSHPQEGVTQ